MRTNFFSHMFNFSMLAKRITDRHGHYRVEEIGKERKVSRVTQTCLRWSAQLLQSITLHVHIPAAVWPGLSPAVLFVPDWKVHLS